MCNEYGTGYDQVDCAHGCDDMTGCKLCEANQTVCANGSVATCDPNGNQTSVTSCPLGCFEDQARCRDIDPSNGLGSYLTAVAAPPDVDLTTGPITIYTDSGKILDASGNQIDIPTFVAVEADGPPIRVFVTRSLKLGAVTARVEVQTGIPPFPALAFVATDDIAVVGHFVVREGVGSLKLPECSGGPGSYNLNSVRYSGSGGGGFATAGAQGGTDTYIGGTAGGTSGNDTLVPLRGGCSSGEHRDANSSDVFDGTAGGGAVQLVSRTKIVIADNASVDASGAYGDWDEHFGASGGGAGGAILIEAPSIDLGNNSSLLAPGGHGADGDGGSCTHPGCGLGGAGATPLTAAQNGLNGSGGGGGGGGGGLGRIRINTADGTYGQQNTTQLVGSLSVGRIATR
ncbi:MAG: hypothetical protein QM831_00320 [Kofleriaceae bacterium]